MKFSKPVLLSAGCAALLALSSCGYNTAAMLNQNNISTQVQLSSNNFRILEHVSGSDNVSYILGIGGAGATQVHQNAYAAMLDKANLKGGAKAIINVVTESHVGGFFPFYYSATVNVSGDVIEFIK